MAYSGDSMNTPPSQSKWFHDAPECTMLILVSIQLYIFDFCSSVVDHMWLAFSRPPLHTQPGFP